MPGLLRGMARTAAVVGTATAVSGNVQRRQQQKWNDQQATAAPEPMAAAPMGESTDQQIAQLQQLAQLKDAGVLTQAEFDAKKQQILGL